MTRCRFFILLYFQIGYEAKRIIDKDEIESLREATREMLRHAYQNYEENAFPKDELMPISCKGKDTWGGYKLTMIEQLVRSGSNMSQNYPTIKNNDLNMYV